MDGSLSGLGTLCAVGSLERLDTLAVCGSLAHTGTLIVIGSLTPFGTLDADGSLSSFGTLDALSLCRFSLPELTIDILDLRPDRFLCPSHPNYFVLTKLGFDRGIKRGVFSVSLC